jgi:predicted nucleotidyltransferase
MSNLRALTPLIVDLVTEKALRPELRPYIEQERVNV